MNCKCTITCDPKVPGRICYLHSAHIAAAVAAEREACAKIVDPPKTEPKSSEARLAKMTRQSLSAAIRARGGT